MIKIPTKTSVFLRSLITVAIGGAAGAIEKMMEVYSASGDFHKMDWHQAGMNAIGGAVLAIAYHFAHPPSTPVVTVAPIVEAEEKSGPEGPHGK